MMTIDKNKLIIPGIIFVLVLSSLNFSGPSVESEPKPEAKITEKEVSISSFSAVIEKPAEVIEIPALDKSTILTPKEIKNILELAGFEGKGLKIAFGIVLKESTGRPYAHNKNSSTGDNSYGLFQINMIGSLGPARRAEFDLANNKELFDPLKNAQIAYTISDGGKNWGPWGGVSQKVLNFMKDFPE